MDTRVWGNHWQHGMSSVTCVLLVTFTDQYSLERRAVTLPSRNMSLSVNVVTMYVVNTRNGNIDTRWRVHCESSNLFSYLVKTGNPQSCCLLLEHSKHLLYFSCIIYWILQSHVVLIYVTIFWCLFSDVFVQWFETFAKGTLSMFVLLFVIFVIAYCKCRLISLSI